MILKRTLIFCFLTLCSISVVTATIGTGDCMKGYQEIINGDLIVRSFFESEPRVDGTNLQPNDVAPGDQAQSVNGVITPGIFLEPKTLGEGFDHDYTQSWSQETYRFKACSRI